MINTDTSGILYVTLYSKVLKVAACLFSINTGFDVKKNSLISY